MGAIKAIETEYKGYRFRSRLEARWAVFLERLGYRWDYEPEGFETPYGRYLPDFRLTWKCPWSTQGVAWLEVRPQTQPAEELKRETWFAEQLENISTNDNHARLFMCVGLPEMPPLPPWYEAPYLAVVVPALIGSRTFHLAKNFGEIDVAYNDDLAAAIKAAKSARFEFGESG